jgi:hypothetical protein
MGHRDTLLYDTTYRKPHNRSFSPTRMRPPLYKRLRSSRLVARFLGSVTRESLPKRKVRFADHPEVISSMAKASNPIRRLSYGI